MCRIKTRLCGRYCNYHTLCRFIGAILRTKFEKNNSDMAKEVTRRQDNYSQWYNDLVVKADLAEQSAVR